VLYFKVQTGQEPRRGLGHLDFEDHFDVGLEAEPADDGENRVDIRAQPASNVHLCRHTDIAVLLRPHSLSCLKTQDLTKGSRQGEQRLPVPV